MKPIKNKDLLFIVNPHSGKKKVTKIVETLHADYPDISTIVTKNLEELENVFLTQLEKYTTIIVVGGDGTVNEATKYLQNKKDKFLGVLPLGSGNGFARELGFKNSLASLIEDAKKGEFIEVDVLSINGENCVNAAGLGFDSFVAHNFQNRNRRGLKSYIYSVLKSVFSFKPFSATIYVGGEKIHDKFQMITIANTRQFGNNAIIAPLANPTDGKFDLVLVQPFAFYKYPVFVVQMFLGTLKSSRFLQFISTDKNVKIESRFKAFHIDGDPKIFTENLSIKIGENKVRIIKTKNCLF